MRQEDELEEDKLIAARMMAEAEATAPRLATMSSISEQRNRWVNCKVLRLVYVCGLWAHVVRRGVIVLGIRLPRQGILQARFGSSVLCACIHACM